MIVCLNTLLNDCVWYITSQHATTFHSLELRPLGNHIRMINCNHNFVHLYVIIMYNIHQVKFSQTLFGDQVGNLHHSAIDIKFLFQYHV